MKNCYSQDVFPACRQQGISLIEVLVAMLIGLFILAGVIKVMVDSKENFIVEQEFANMQENARFVAEEIAFEVRMAGYRGCQTDGFLSNTLAANAANDWMFSRRAISGYEYDDAVKISEFAATPGIANGTDVLIINRGDPMESAVISDHNQSAHRFTLNDPHAFSTGDIVLAVTANCDYAAIFQVSETPTSTSLDHDKAGLNPGNCSHALSTADNGGTDYDCTSAPASAVLGLDFDTGGTGGTMMHFKSTAYYIKLSSITGVPTLYRRVLANQANKAVTLEQDLISGVEDMEVSYGVDTSNPADGVVDRYYDADSITVDEATTTNRIAWDRVLSVRTIFILRSIRQAFPTAQDLDLGGGFNSSNADTPYLKGTRYMYQKVSASARIRNRGIGLNYAN